MLQFARADDIVAFISELALVACFSDKNCEGSLIMSRRKVDLIVKFGGSAITNKNQLEVLKQAELDKAAILIEECIQKNMTCVVVHGAGSFGHHQAKQHSVNSGFLHLEAAAAHAARIGFCQTHTSVAKPCSSWVTRNKEVISSGLDTLSHLLDAGFVPVIHGDTVRDTNIGGCILSGDTIIKTLCEEFTVHHVVFLTDVDGIYDRPPDQTGAVLLPCIGVNKHRPLAIGTSSSDVTDGVIRTCPEERDGQTTISTSASPYDVTGGVQLKIETARDIVVTTQGETKVHVCKIGSDSSHALCLGHDGASFTGTEIVL
ncbi:isopentenyl phosphate kinase-like isoform X2 [Haliotis rufescens]|uniref:isopentenyl phosphate kinase-like isoform X2 n=1 Tax=Haliotis rufescens TaxID=6454 RepID=UPI00201EA411|nr:isopentenyl phosphate kinase-like isoform X2 [Haliotis rufescens]